MLMVAAVLLLLCAVPLIGGEDTQSRTEECLECARGCLKWPEIKELVTQEKHIDYVVFGVPWLYGIICAGISAVTWLKTGRAERVQFYSLASLFSCQLVMRLLLEVLTNPFVNDIKWQMIQLGCTCATYCGDFA